MYINFLDTKKVIIFSLIQYYTAMVLTSPKYYTSRYFKKQFKTTFYIHNAHKARRSLDYSYKDWEEKKPDIYDYLLPSTNQTSSKEYFNFTETSPKTMIDPELITNPPLESSNVGFQSIEATPVTSLPIPYTNSTLFSIFNTTTTTLIPEISTENIITLTTAPSTVTLIDPVYQSIKDEIEESKTKHRGGYFTGSVYVLLKITERKRGDDVKALLVGLQKEFNKLNSQQRLAKFGPMVNSVFTSIIRMMVSSPVELIQLQAKNGQELIENKRGGFQTDTRSLFEIIDAIYLEEDYIHIVESLKDIQNFPDVSKREIDVAEEAMEAFILLPYTRIEGTNIENLLVTEINNVLEKRIAFEAPMRQHFRKYFEISTKMKTSSESISKYEGTPSSLKLE